MKRALCWIGGIVLVLAAVLAIVVSQLDTGFISDQGRACASRPGAARPIWSWNRCCTGNWSSGKSVWTALR